MRHLVLVWLMLVVALSARADVLTLQAIKDNTLIESPDGSVSSGASERFFVGRTNQMSNSIRRSVIAFDLGGMIPAGSIVHSVALELTLVSSNGPSDVALHRLLADWGEGDSFAMSGSGAPSADGDATWLHTFYPGAFWTSSGGDFDGVLSAGARVDAGVTSKPTWSSAGMVADVEAWIDDPSMQFGWILVGDESINQTTQTFASRERPTLEERPELRISFTPPMGPVIHEVALGAVADATLIESMLGMCTANGASLLFSGTTPVEPAIRRAVLRFDVDSRLPSDALIQSATLELVPNATLLVHVIAAHRLDGVWGEGDECPPGSPTCGPAIGEPAELGSATWHHQFFDTDLWTTPGGDFDPVASAAAFVDATAPDSGSWSSEELASDVQGWVDDPSSNFGWILIGDEREGLGSVARFPSRESVTPEDRPRLVVQYIPEPRSTLLGLAAIGPLLLRVAHRSRVRHSRP